MKQQAIGIAVATIAIYMWGFLFWGATTIPYSPLKATPDDEAAQALLMEHFPETGAYLIPGMHNETETMSRLAEAGPFAIVNIVRRGHPVEDPALMLRGFLLTIAIAYLMSLVLKKAVPALPTYENRVTFAALVGVAAVVMINMGEVVWWRYDLGWKLTQALYGVGVWTVGGAVLAKFIKPDASR